MFCRDVKRVLSYSETRDSIILTFDVINSIIGHIYPFIHVRPLPIIRIINDVSEVILDIYHEFKYIMSLNDIV